MVKATDIWLGRLGKLAVLIAAVAMVVSLSRHTAIGHDAFGLEQQSSVNFVPGGCGCPLCCKA